MLSLLPYKILTFFERLKKPKYYKYPLVKFDFETMPKQHHEFYEVFRGKTLLLLGEIKQMQGHCILIDIKSGEIHSCYHTDNFIELTEEEV